MKIGIDFGTTFSLPATISENRAEVLLPRSLSGIPSVFYYDKDHGVLAGRKADNRADINPENAKREVKMDLNKPLSEWEFIADGKSFTRIEIISHIFREIIKNAIGVLVEKGFTSREISGAVVSVPAKFELREKCKRAVDGEPLLNENIRKNAQKSEPRQSA